MSDSMRSIHRGLRTFTHLTNHWFQTPPKGLGERNSLGPLSIQPRQLEARAITLYVSRISEHTRITHILFILAPVLFPLCHVINPAVNSAPRIPQWFVCGGSQITLIVLIRECEEALTDMHCLSFLPTTVKGSWGGNAVKDIE